MTPMISGIPEHTRRTIDATSATATAISAVGATVPFTLNQAASVVGIIVGLLTIAWYILRFVDRIRFGPSSGD